MKISIIREKDLKKADLLQEEILWEDRKRYGNTFTFFKKRYTKNPSLFIGCYDKSKLVGIIFGYIKRNYVSLSTMAISSDYRSKGIGSKMLNVFERNVKKLGKKRILLGARNNAEKFYLNNGYKPIIFVQIYHKNVPKDYKNKGYNIISETNYKDAKRLYIDIKKYDKKIKEKVLKTFKAYNVIYLFEKDLE